MKQGREPIRDPDQLQRICLACGKLILPDEHYTSVSNGKKDWYEHTSHEKPVSLHTMLVVAGASVVVRRRFQGPPT